jgi:hypothetical protein
MARRRGRSVPASGEATAGLDAGVRRFVASTAERRAALELHGAAAFTAVTQALVELRADSRIVEMSARSIAEEIDHSNIYLSLARAYAMEDVAAPRPSSIDIPEYRDAGADAQRLLRVVGMCSINETMACGFLELCLRGAKAVPVREGLRSVLEDEIRHARIGWALLGSPDVGPAERRLLSAWLLPMLRTQWQGWRDQIATLPEGEQVEHGCPSKVAIERAARASIADLVLPGFEQAGVDATKAREWFDTMPE